MAVPSAAVAFIAAALLAVPSHGQRLFETCAASGGAREVRLAQQRVSVEASPSPNGSSVSYRCGTNPSRCSCNADEMLLYSFEYSGVQQSCCPVDYASKNETSVMECSGCERFSAGRCEKCAGGFERMLLGGKSECVACSNSPNFVDADGLSCADYASKGYCADGSPSPGNEARAATRYNYISAEDACCACGGGKVSPTRFEYRIVRSGGSGLLGKPFEAKPVPRTANEYLVDSGCNLQTYGLTIDGNTGVITGTPTNNEPFDIACTITARTRRPFREGRRTSSFLEYNTTLRISVSEFGFTASDDATQSRTTVLAFDENTLARSYSVVASTAFAADSGRNYSMTCAPGFFATIDSKTGTIRLDSTSKADYAKKFAEAHGRARVARKENSPSGTETLMAAACLVRAKDSKGKEASIMVHMFAYPPVDAALRLTFAPASSIKVTVGQPVMQPLSFGFSSQNSSSDAPYATTPVPGLYNVNLDCESNVDGLIVRHELTTGDVTIDGLTAFNVDPLSGRVSGSPHVGIRSLMPASNGRRSVTVMCEAYAAIASASTSTGQVQLLPAADVLVVQVEEDACWVDASGYTSPTGWVPTLANPSGSSSPSAAACQAACSSDKGCVGYNFAQSKCYKIGLTQSIVGLAEERKLKTGQAMLKVPNCQLHQTCIRVDIPGQSYISGRYCPVVTSTLSAPEPLYVMKGYNPEDTFYLQRAEPRVVLAMSEVEGCEASNTAWVIRKGSPRGDDLIDAETGYTELHGKVEACVHDDLLSSPAFNSPVASFADVQTSFKATPASFSETLAGKVPTKYPTAYPTKYPTKLPTKLPTKVPTKVPTKLPTKVPTKLPTKVPTKLPTKAPTQKMDAPAFETRPVFDAVPDSSSSGGGTGIVSIRGKKTAHVAVFPAGRSCFNPLTGPDSKKEDDKSSDEDSGGNQEEETPREKEAMDGMIKGDSTQVNPEDLKKLVFQFDDPATSVANDYHLHPCQCGFEKWGKRFPVLDDTYALASEGAMKPGMSFNRWNPTKIPLWEGPHVCDQRFLIEQRYDVSSCTAECADNPSCKFFVQAETNEGASCMLFSDCQQMTRVSSGAQARAFAISRPGSEQLCHLANPEMCNAITRRRARLTGMDHGFGECVHQKLVDQCEYNLLMGDKDIEKCFPCTYMVASSQPQKVAMPKELPHGARLTVSCLKGPYKAVNARGADGSLTCVDGEWRDNTGSLGLSNIQCAGCVQVLSSGRKAKTMQLAENEELIFLGNRNMGIFSQTSDELPSWIEGESATSIALKTRADIGTQFSWQVQLDGNKALQLVNPVGGKCLGVKNFETGTKGALDVLSLQRCELAQNVFSLVETMQAETSADEGASAEIATPRGAGTPAGVDKVPNAQFTQVLAGKNVVPTKFPTKYPSSFPSAIPTRFPTRFPTGDASVIISPLEVMMRVGRQQPDVAARATSTGWYCDNSGYITAFGSNQGKCSKRAQSKKAGSTVVAPSVFTSESNDIMCPKGGLITSFYKNGAEHAVTCNPMPVLGGCTGVKAKVKQTAGLNTLAALQSSAVKCPPLSAVAGVTATYGGANKITSIELTCCEVPAFSGFSMAPGKLTGFLQYEGVYCPSGYDALLRPVFTQTSAFDQSHQISMLETASAERPGSRLSEIAFGQQASGSFVETESFTEVLAGKAPTKYPTSYPTKYPTKHPTKHPTKYPTALPTAFPTYYPTPGTQSVAAAKISFDKRTNAWCLTGPSFAKPQCTGVANVEHPLEIDWLKAKATFSVTGLADMKGMGMTAPGTVAMGAGDAPPKKPALVKLETVDPEYNEGCVAMSKNKFDVAAETFADTNPCGMIATKTYKVKAKPRGPGLSYADINQCSKREIDRRWVLWRAKLAADATGLSISKATELGSLLCMPLPTLITGTGAGGPPFIATETKVDGKCFKAYDLGGDIASGLAAMAAQVEPIMNLMKGHEKQSYIVQNAEDCSPIREGTDRILCDLYCLKDAVKSGTKAVLANLKLANQNILLNTDMLLNYYAQVVTHKVKQEVKKYAPKPSGSFLQASDGARSMLVKLSETVEKYRDPHRLLEGRDGVDKVATSLLSAHQTAADTVSRTFDGVRSATTENDATEMLERCVEEIDASLGRAHRHAAFTLAGARSDPHAAARKDSANRMRETIRDTATQLNRTYGLNHEILASEIARNEIFLGLGDSLFRAMSTAVRAGGLQSPEGVLNWKLDRLADKVDAFQHLRETNNLRRHLNQLSRHWETIATETGEYMEVAQSESRTYTELMSGIQDYLECGSDASFLSQASRIGNEAADASAGALRRAWPRVLRSVEESLDIMRLSDIIPRSFAAAAAAVTLPAEDKPAAAYLTSDGVSTVRGLFEAALDGGPRALALQAVEAHSKARFLQDRMFADGGQTPTKTETQQLEASFKRFLSSFEKNALAFKRNSASILGHVVDTALIEAFPAPPLCKALAFKKYQHGDTRHLVEIKRLDDGARLITKPLGSLLAYSKPFRVTLSKKPSGIPDDFPVAGLLSHTFVCSKVSDQWQLLKATELPEDQGVTLCAEGAGCRDGDVVIGSAAASAAKLASRIVQ